MAKAAVIPDIPATRPKSIGAAKGLIARILQENEWNEDEQARYFALKGLKARTADELSPEEVRTVIAKMEASRMINFAD
jgi:hypothetical protein